MISGGFNLSIDVPPMLYGVLGALGIVVSVYLGWFDWWVLFFIVVVAGLIAIIIWMREG
jgi:hypothetical protein